MVGAGPMRAEGYVNVRCFFILNRTKFLSKLVWRETFQTSHISSSSFFFLVNFENLTVEFHVPYVFNIHIKFHSNLILFTI